MPELEVMIGGRPFRVACQAGEEAYLKTASGMLDKEASALVDQIGRLPEGRMLLMSGLMLADRTAAAEEKLAEVQQELARQVALVKELQSAPPPEPRVVEVPVVPESVGESLAELAARTESLADQIEEKLTG